MTLSLKLLPQRLAVCQIAPESPFPNWAQSTRMLSLTRTPDELSIVCEEKFVPEEVSAERGWRALKVNGPLDFSLIGILAALATTLAAAEISIFALSTYNTDYLLLKEANLARAFKALESAGYTLTN